MRFRTTILQGDKTATGIRVPDEVTAALWSEQTPAGSGHGQRLLLPHHGGLGERHLHVRR